MIIAFLNVCTLLLLIYLILQLIREPRGSVFGLLDKIFSPALDPLRKTLPETRIDLAAIVVMVVLQLLAYTVKRVM